ncbi:helix-turn-helix transcriptional regulator [Candidatus Nitrosopumilus sediminis]|nr:transcriptional regulator [Candidatus Nitrosopumilus sediminis]
MARILTKCLETDMSSLCMVDVSEIVSAELFEMASEQRIAILMQLQKEQTSLSGMAKKLNATAPEIHRNISRLLKMEAIKKETDGSYCLTTKGKLVCNIFPQLQFITKSQTYFKDHTLDELPKKFQSRIGELSSGKEIKGYVKVMETCKDIYANAQKYICNILSEVPYTEDITRPLVTGLKNGITVSTIFSESVVVPSDRKKIFKNKGFKKFVDDGKVKRKMVKDVKIVLVLNEKEAGVVFPKDGEADMSKMFYGDSPEFLEWCHDYFIHCWNSASSFQESKIR